MIKEYILVYSIIAVLFTPSIQGIPIDMEHAVQQLGEIYKFRCLNKSSIQEITDISFFKEVTEGFIYFGRKSCRYCLKFDDILTEILDKHQIDIYLFDAEKWRDDPYFHKILEQYQVSYIPHFIRVSKEGEMKILNLSDINDNQGSLLELEKFIISNR